jgi:hypothetical protein
MTYLYLAVGSVPKVPPARFKLSVPFCETVFNDPEPEDILSEPI